MQAYTRKFVSAEVRSLETLEAFEPGKNIT
uniref:Uncharacterized protein n=1 Tax=Tetraselmis sp. GSL018 TaxID=582737 RepID=A0A061SF12_9CHLO